jgi:hypothetical protein
MVLPLASFAGAVNMYDMPPSSKRVFISHASADKPLARTLAAQLRTHGLDAWLDDHVVHAGRSWRESVGSQLDSSDIFVVLVTEDSQHSPWARRESTEILKRAWADDSKIVLPVIIGTAEPPGFLRDHLALHMDLEPSTSAEELFRWITSRTLPRGVSRSEAGDSRLDRRLAELERTAASLANAEDAES